jgi:hypothetical protein
MRREFMDLRIGFNFEMSEIFVAKVDDFFYLKDSFGCLISFRNEQNINFKIGNKVRLITPTNEIVETGIKHIPMISRRYEEGKVPDFKLISIGIENTERNKKGFVKGTKIYLIGD